jgi:hypothetical protein
LKQSGVSERIAHSMNSYLLSWNLFIRFSFSCAFGGFLLPKT